MDSEEKGRQGACFDFGDSEKIFANLLEIGINARFTVDKVWESAKFITTLTSAILTVSILIFASAVNGEALPLSIVLCLPLILIAVSFIGVFNLRREYRHFLEWFVSAQKHYELLGFTNNFNFKRFRKDTFLLPENFTSREFESTKDFIKNAFNKPDTLLFLFTLLHICYILLAAVQIGLLISSRLWA